MGRWSRAVQALNSLRRKTWALWYAYRDPATPWYAKAWAAVVLAYAFSPIDLVPDFIPVLGYLDDLLLVPAGVAIAVKLIPPEVMARAEEQARQREAAGGGARPRNWFAGAAVIAAWLAVAFLAGRAAWRALRPR